MRGNCIVVTKQLKEWARNMKIGEKTLKAIVEDFIDKDPNHRYPTKEQLLASRGTMVANARNRVNTSEGSAWRAAQEPYKFKLTKESLMNAKAPDRGHINPNDPLMVSGGAQGADTMWAAMADIYKESTKMRAHNLTTTNYEALGHGGYNEEYRKKATQLIRDTYDSVAEELARPKYGVGTYNRKLQERDIAQALMANGIYAIGYLQRPGEQVGRFTNSADHTVVAGGTGWAVQAAIHLNEQFKKEPRLKAIYGNKESKSGEKEIHVFDIEENKWYRWDSSITRTLVDPVSKNEYEVNGDFVEEETPRLTNHFAGIGTRNLEDMRKAKSEQYDDALNAIQAVFEKTYGPIPSGVDFKTAIDKRVEEAKTKKEDEEQRQTETTWGKEAKNGYEVSTFGDKRFSPMVATFKEGTKLKDIFPDEKEDINIGGKTIEDVYQNFVKKSGKNKPPATTSRLYRSDLKGDEAHEFTYNEGYLPLWRLWAKQHPVLMRDLKKKAAGKVLTDRFGNEHVSQARALAQILNEMAQSEINVAEAKRTAKNLAPVKAKHGRRFDQADGTITRENAANDSRTLYIFTDNTDRDSGSLPIDEDSWYVQKYGKDDKGNIVKTLHYATRTMAILRGLPNAFPISTQKHYTKGASVESGRWANNPADIEEFKRVLDDEIEEIKKAWKSGKYDRVIIPANGFFGSSISNINMDDHGGYTEDGEHHEGVYEYLARKLRELEQLVTDKTVVIDELTGVTGTEAESTRATKSKLNITVPSDLSIDEEDMDRGIFKAREKPGNEEKANEQTQEKPVEEPQPKQEKTQSVNPSTGKVANKNEKKANDVTSLQKERERLKAMNDERDAWLRIFQNESNDEVQARYNTNLEKLTNQHGLTRKQITDMTSFCANNFFAIVKRNVGTLRDYLESQLDPSVTPDELDRLAIQKRIDRLNNGDTAHMEVLDTAGFAGIGALVKRRVAQYCDENAVEGYRDDRDLLSKYQYAFGIEGDEAREAMANHRRLFSILNDDEVFGIIMQMALPRIQRLENIKVEINGKGKKPGIKDSSKTTETIDGFATEDEFGDYAEGWNFHAMEVDPHETLRNIVRNALVDLAEKKHDGHFVMDSLGQETRIDEQYVHAVIINECAKSFLYAEDFYWEEEDPDPDPDWSDQNEKGEYVIMHFPVLEKLRNKFPFMDDLIDELKLNGQLRSAFYNEFHKIKLDHTIIAEDSGNSVLINHTASTIAAVNTARNVYERGITELNGYTTIWTTEWTPNEARIEDVMQTAAAARMRIEEIIEKGVEAIEDERNRDVVEFYVDKATEVLNSLGFDMDRDDLAQLFTADDINRVVAALDYAWRVMNDYSKKFRLKENGPEYHLFDSCRNDLFQIGENVGRVSTNYIQLSVNQGGVQMQSYVAPNYIGAMIRRMKDKSVLPDGTMRLYTYLDGDFTKDDFLYDKDKVREDNKKGEFRCEWLRRLREGIETGEMRPEDVLSICEVSIIGKEKLPKCSPETVKRNAIAMYFSFGEDSQMAWYLVPNYSDAPSSNFIRFHKYTDHEVEIVEEDGITYHKEFVSFEDEMRPLFRNLVLQELSRIKKVQAMQARGVVMPVNLEERGQAFCFLPSLNDLKVGDIDGLDARIAGDNGDVTFLERLIALNSDANPANYNDAMELIDSAVNTVMYEGYLDFRRELLGMPEDEVPVDKETGERLPTENEEAIFKILDKKGADRDLQNRRVTRQDKNRLLQEYYWNTVFATSQIYQLCCTDLAYYKDDVDAQKRFKQLHVFGTKLNIFAKYGRRYEHAVYLADENIMSSAINGIEKSLDKAVAQKRMSRRDADTYIHIFENICRTDGQAYRSVKSYRSIMSMLGKWTPELENAIERMQNGKFEKADLDAVFEVIKPYMFSNIITPDGVGGYLRTPMQNKNSEVMLMSTLGMMAGILGQSSQLKALGQYMDANGIDVAMFASACKIGSRGIIDINTSSTKVEKAAKNGYIEVKVPEGHGKHKKYVKKRFNVVGTTYDEFMHGVKDKATGRVIQDGFDQRLKKNKNGDYENGITSEDHVAIQHYFRPSENEVRDTLERHVFSVVNYADEAKTDPVDVMEPFENQDTELSEAERERHQMYNTSYMVKIPFEDYCIVQPTLNHMVDTKVNIGSQYQNLILAGLPDKIDVWGTEMSRDDVRRHYQALFTENLMEDFKSVYGKFSTIENLRDALMGMVEQNPMFGPDLLNALELVDFNGKKVFNIPFGSPQMLFQISTMINSMFRKGIVKQRMRGGYAYLMSDYGLRGLKVRRVENGDDAGRIYYAECLLPATSKEAFKEYMDEKGNIDIKRVSQENPRLLQMVGYRTPTEGKWSMTTLQVVGFLPPQCGNTIVLPADLVAQFGHDFDIDKMFLMMYDFETDDDTGHVYVPKYKESVEGTDVNRSVAKNNRKQRNNRLLDLTYGILSSPGVDVESNSPNSFENIRAQSVTNEMLQDKALMGKMVDEINRQVDGILSDPSTTDAMRKRIADFMARATRDGDAENGQLTRLNAETVKALSRDHAGFLSKFVKKNRTRVNMLSPNAYIRFFEQNMAGRMLVGIFAVHNTSYCKMQGHGLRLKDDEWYWSKGQKKKMNFCFSINGRKVDQMDKEYIVFKDSSGQIIGRQSILKNLGEFVAASVDNGKDPLIKWLGLNPETGGLGGFLLRAGFTIEELGIFLSHPAIKPIVDEAANVGLGVALSTFTEGLKLPDIDSLRESELNIDTDRMLQNIMDAANDKKHGSDFAKNNARLLALFKHIVSLYNDFNSFVQVTRPDSVNGTIKNTIASATKKKMDLDFLLNKSRQSNFAFTGVENVLENGLLLGDNGKFLTKDGKLDIDAMREILGKRMFERVQAYHTFGIEAATILPAEYFHQLTPFMNNILMKLAKECGGLSEKTINDIYDASTAFLLTSGGFFGTKRDENGEEDEDLTYTARRYYYVNEFPNIFRSMLREKGEEIAAINEVGFIQRLGVYRGRKGTEIRMKDGADVNGLLLENYMNDMLLLLNMGGKAKQLAIDLFRYCFYKDGFKFGPNSFSRMFSSRFLAAFPGFVDVLRGASDSMRLPEGSDKGSTQTLTFWDRFEDQLYSNMPEKLITRTLSTKTNKSLVEALEKMVANGSEQVVLKRDMVENFFWREGKGKMSTHKYIRINDWSSGSLDVYYLKRLSEDDKNVTYGFLVEAPVSVFYDAMKDSQTIAEEWDAIDTWRKGLREDMKVSLSRIKEIKKSINADKSSGKAASKTGGYRAHFGKSAMIGTNAKKGKMAKTATGTSSGNSTDTDMAAIEVNEGTRMDPVSNGPGFSVSTDLVEQTMNGYGDRNYSEGDISELDPTGDRVVSEGNLIYDSKTGRVRDITSSDKRTGQWTNILYGSPTTTFNLSDGTPVNRNEGFDDQNQLPNCKSK